MPNDTGASLEYSSGHERLRLEAWDEDSIRVRAGQAHIAEDLPDALIPPRPAPSDNVREDLSVVGFDDIPLSEWSTPALTTVRQPLTEMARVAVQILLESGESGEPVRRRVELATDLVVRESTAQPGST